MSFVKENVNRQPIVDTVFAIVKKAKEDKEKIGEENVVDATIGSLYNEQESPVALDSGFFVEKSVQQSIGCVCGKLYRK